MMNTRENHDVAVRFLRFFALCLIEGAVLICNPYPYLTRPEMHFRPTCAHGLRIITISLLLITMLPASAAAFCGFYVAGSGDDLYNDATQVVLMREGTTTVLSMENNYRGPLEDFAMVVPVPQVLMQDQVKTLDPAVFRHIDKLSAPRLVQYWEKNPCEDNVIEYDTYINGCDYGYYNNTSNNNAYNEPIFDMGTSGEQDMASSPVVIEAQFAVGEYEILVLSSEEATGLENWLTTNNYNIPAGATEIFEQYIQQGMYFFVAKIDPSKVTFEDGQAVLSPLRFHYTSPEFSLPIRLGMVNSGGEQDLLVYTLGFGQRYGLANYPNALIPTNLNVTEEVKQDFPAFYEKVFSRTLAENPGAIVTEYAWGAGKCDPCPEAPLSLDDMATFGGDVVAPDEIGGEVDPWNASALLNQLTITRLHARYGKNAMTQDLVFTAAVPVYGGRGSAGTNHQPTQLDSADNQFQGRYIIHNQYPGEYACEHKVRGRWNGPPPSGEDRAPSVAPGPNTTGEVAEDTLAGKSIEDLLDGTVPETGQPLYIENIVDLGVCEDPAAENYMKPPSQMVDDEGNVTDIPPSERQPSNQTPDEEEGSRGCNTTTAGGASGGFLMLLAGLAFGFARRRRRA